MSNRRSVSIQPIASEVESTVKDFGLFWVNVEKRPRNFSLETPMTKKATMAPFRAFQKLRAQNRSGWRWYQVGALLLAGYVGLLYAACKLVELNILGYTLPR